MHNHVFLNLDTALNQGGENQHRCDNLIFKISLGSMHPEPPGGSRLRRLVPLLLGTYPPAKNLPTGLTTDILHAPGNASDACVSVDCRCYLSITHGVRNL